MFCDVSGHKYFLRGDARMLIVVCCFSELE